MPIGNDNFGDGDFPYDPHEFDRDSCARAESHVVAYTRTVVLRTRGAVAGPHLNTTDLVQDALLAIQRKLKDGKGPKKGKPWKLWVRDTARDVVRQMMRREVVLGGSIDVDPADSTTSVVGKCVRGEQEAIVRDALSRLDPESARILDLCYRDGLSVGEIAESLGRCAPYVRGRRDEALTRLGEILLSTGVHPNPPDL